MGIPLADLKRSLGSLLTFHEKVTTGYSSHREVCANTQGWCADRQALTVYASHNTDGVVDAIWTDHLCLTPEQQSRAVAVFSALPRRHELLLADWNQLTVVALDDDVRLRAYLYREDEGPGVVIGHVRDLEPGRNNKKKL